ncbi:MAG: hypothetical protein PF694_00945 [Bacteroidetes bacterium]|jgi:hypothetical protein|nr:hypothetical protein [Bacteroidota bacterium]
MKLKTSKGTIITVDSKYINKGGQGAVHKVLTPARSPLNVAKLYFDHILQNRKAGGVKYSDTLEKKIGFMVQNNPFLNEPQKIKDAFAWPIDLLYDNNNSFKGYLMPFVQHSLTLSQIIASSTLLHPWDSFHINNPGSFNTRLKICYNIAQAIEVIHASGFYTLIDLKGENMMLRQNGFISLIDLDSIQISQNNKLLFQAEVITSEFCPPEHHNGLVDYNADLIKQSWDLFSLAVLFYKLLFNIHPFGGLTHKKKPEYHTVDDFITKGIFAHGNNRNQISLAPPHGNFHQLLDQSLQDMFLLCFEKGYKNAALRPSAAEWKKAWLASIQKNAGKKINGGINQPVRTNVQPKAKPNPLFNGNKLVPADQLNKPMLLKTTIGLNKKKKKSTSPVNLGTLINQPISKLRITQNVLQLNQLKKIDKHIVSLNNAQYIILQKPTLDLIHIKSNMQKTDKSFFKALVIIFFLIVFQLAIMDKQTKIMKL